MTDIQARKQRVTISSFHQPDYGAYVVAGWLAGIILNLLTLSGYYDIALRDFGLMLGALTLARLASVYDAPLRRRGEARGEPASERRRVPPACRSAPPTGTQRSAARRTRAGLPSGKPPSDALVPTTVVPPSATTTCEAPATGMLRTTRASPAPSPAEIDRSARNATGVAVDRPSCSASGR